MARRHRSSVRLRVRPPPRHVGRSHTSGHQRLVPPPLAAGCGASRRAPGCHVRAFRRRSRARQRPPLRPRAPRLTLSPADADRFAQQWAAAKAAIPSLDTTVKAVAAGYVLSSTPAPGVGVHWVNWQLIAQPFDPARPAMLLFTGPLGHRPPRRLLVLGAGHLPAGRVRRDQRPVAHPRRPVRRERLGRAGGASPCRPTARAAGWPVATSGCSTPGSSTATRTAGVASPRANPKLCPTGQVPDLASCTPDLG